MPWMPSIARYYANVHRGAYLLSEETTTAYEEARGKVARFVNAGSRSEVVFTRGATTALNTVAFGWGMDHLQAGDRILLTMMEHHANVVPWQLVARRTGAELVYLPMTDDYQLDLDRLPEFLDERVKSLLVHRHVERDGDDATGRRARQNGTGCRCARCCRCCPVDHPRSGRCPETRSRCHCVLRPQDAGSHRYRSPLGSPSLLEEMEPFEGGGEMISDVRLDGSTWAPVPHKFEAGTPPFVEAIGLGAATDYLEKIGMDGGAPAWPRYSPPMHCSNWPGCPPVRVFGPADLDRRGGVISFSLGDIHPHDVATILDQEGVAVRAGHHCAKPLTRALGVPATVRASFQVYNTREDVDALLAGLHKVQEVFRVD